jgi:hypothetical protein
MALTDQWSQCEKPQRQNVFLVIDLQPPSFPGLACLSAFAQYFDRLKNRKNMTSIFFKWFFDYNSRQKIRQDKMYYFAHLCRVRTSIFVSDVHH